MYIYIYIYIHIYIYRERVVTCQVKAHATSEEVSSAVVDALTNGAAKKTRPCKYGCEQQQKTIEYITKSKRQGAFT